MSDRRPARRWTTWSGRQTAHPCARERPATVAGVQAVVAGAARRGRRVKPIGSGHSFTACAVADDVQVDLSGLSGIVSSGRKAGEVTVRAGTTLADLNGALWHRGLALANLGDIDRQTVSGATMTGTHGTGAGFTGLADAVTGLEIVLATGDVVQCSARRHGDLFEAARLSFGSLGVVTSLTYRCVPAFPLHAVEAGERLDQVLAGIQHEADACDHFEFHWFPHTDRLLAKRNTRREPGSPTAPLARWRYLVDDELLSNVVFGVIGQVSSRAPRLVPAINQVSARALGRREYVDRSYRVFTSPRRVRFNESEYALPREHVGDVLGELRSWIERHGDVTPFPVEVRFAGADDVWLSTAYRRATAYIAVHQHHRMSHRRYFDAFERIVAGVDGRPHWGKLHTLGPERLRELYPRFDEFCRVRDEVDPGRVFANGYTEQVLGA